MSNDARYVAAKKPITAIKKNPNNPRIIKDDKFKKLVASVKAFPQMLDIRPIVCNADMVVLGGNMRLAACKEAGLKEVPVIIADTLTEDQQREFIIKDNVSGGEWDWEMLGNEWDMEQLDAWGLDIPEMAHEPLQGLADEDAVPEAPAEPVTRLGDIWTLGNHRLMCGDSTSIDAVEKLMDGEKADMVFTDPPYGISYDNEDRWSGIKKQYCSIKRNKNKMIIGDSENFDPSFILSFFCYCSEIFIWGMQYYPQHLGRGGCIVWNRKTESQKDVPHADFELCWSKKERNKMAWITWGGFKSKEKGEDRLHTTQKPISLVEWFFDNWGKGINIVVDLFGGSGTTMIAAEKTGRKSRLMELDPKYCDVIIKRWQDFTGKDAILSDGRTFAEVSNAK